MWPIVSFIANWLIIKGMAQSHAKFKKGDIVSWKWGRYRAYGHVAEIFTHSVTRTIKGARVTRNGTPQEPAYMLVQEKGNEVLKSQSELSIEAVTAPG